MPFIVRHARFVLVVAVVLTLLAAGMTASLRPETSLQQLLDAKEPSVIAMSRVASRFPVAEDLLLFVELPPDAPPAAQPMLASFAERFSDAIRSDPEARDLIADIRFKADPEMLEFFEKVVVPNGLYYVNDDQYERLCERLTPRGMADQLGRSRSVLAVPGPAAEGLGRAILKDPLRLHEFLRGGMAQFPGVPSFTTSGMQLSADGRGLLMRLSGTRPPTDLPFCKQLIGVTHRIAASSNHEGLHIELSGAYAIAAHNVAAIRSDAIWNVCSAVTAFALLFAFLFRRPARYFLVAMAPVAMGILLGFAVYSVFSRTITPLAAVIGGSLSGIGIDYPIHFLSHYENLRRKGRSAADSAEAAISLISRPLFGAFVTTMLGFVVIIFSPIRVLRDFSIIGSLGLLGVWAATNIVLPAVVVLFDRGREDERTIVSRWIMPRRAGVFLARHSRFFVLASLALILVMVSAMGVLGIRPRFDAELSALHPRPNPPLDAQRRIAERMGLTVDSVLVHLSAETPDALLRLSHLARRALASPECRGAGIGGSFGLSSLLPDPAVVQQRSHTTALDASDRVEDDFTSAVAASTFRPGAFASYTTFLRTLVRPPVPPTMSDLLARPGVARLVLARDALDGRPAVESLMTVFTSGSMGDRTSRDVTLNAIHGALSGLQGVAVTGTVAITHDVETAIQSEFPFLLSLAVVAIFLYLVIDLRSLGLAVLASLPAAFSLLCLLLFLRITGRQVNIVNMVMMPLLLGITVDYGIFAVSLARTEPTVRGLLRHFSASFTAMLACAATTTLGFGSLIFTSVPAVSSLGWLINVGLIASVACMTLGVWPAVFAWSMRSRQARPCP